MILGRTGGLGGRLLAAEDCHSVLVFGPPGSFKTAGVVIPAILEWTGPVLATSVKPDVIKATRAHRERRGEVVVLDPLGSSGLAGARWTPLAFCRSWAGAQQMAATIAHTADLGTLGTAEHKYWKTLGQKLLAPLLFAAARDDRTMAEVLRWVDLREDNEVAKLLEDAGVDGAITAWEASQSPHRQGPRLGLWHRRGPAGDLRRRTRPALHRRPRPDTSRTSWPATTPSTCTPRSMSSGGCGRCSRRWPCSWSRPPKNRPPGRRMGCWTRGCCAPWMRPATSPPWSSSPSGRPPAAARASSCCRVWHDQAQLVHRYGDRAATILNGHRAKVFLSGLADVGALELGSKLIGDQAVTETNYSTDPGGRVAASQATSYRPLVPVEELRRLQPGEGIVIYGHLRPARIQVRPHFSRPRAALAPTPGTPGHPPARSARPVRPPAPSSGPPGVRPASSSG